MRSVLVQREGESWHRALAAAGLLVDACLTDDGTWARARPAGPPAVS